MNPVSEKTISLTLVPVEVSILAVGPKSQVNSVPAGPLLVPTKSKLLLKIQRESFEV